MIQRDRSTGWRCAKLSGHKNEDLVKYYLDTDTEFAHQFLKRVDYSYEAIIKTSVGGLHETNVPSVNGNKTKSKTDLKVYLTNNKLINVSVKKSLSGQVYLVRAGLFIDTFEKQFNKHIPSAVQKAINLFWSADADALDIIKNYADKSNLKNYNLQIRHKSLNATTLKSYDENLYTALLNWFKENSYELAKLSFSMGSVLEKAEWSDFIWYINLLGENNSDNIFYIEDICNASKKYAEYETAFSTTNGGTTIQLPFGFVQWHQSQLQFHHRYDKLCKILNHY